MQSIALEMLHYQLEVSRGVAMEIKGANMSHGVCTTMT